MSFAVDGVDHVEVFVRDIDAAVRWYGEVLGLRKGPSWEPEPVMIGAGRNYLALFRAQRPGPDNGDDYRQPLIRWRRVAWRTSEEGFAAAQRHLQAKGVVFAGPVDHGRAQSLYFNDPDGNPLEITCDTDTDSP